MIITADWLLPVSGLPIEHGAVLARGPRIVEVGTFDEVLARHPAEHVDSFPGCTIVPGLVNAHTHLSLTVLGDLLGKAPLAEWLPRVATAIRAMSDDDFAASAALGGTMCLSSGVTCVGDIVYGPEPLAACADLGLAGAFFWEVVGIDAGELSGDLAEREFPAESDSCSVGRQRCGISPHTAYTSGPELIRAAWNVAHRHGTRYAIHVSESEAERHLMVGGSGPLVEPARRLALGFTPPHTGTVAYLEKIGTLQDAIAVHCVHLEAGDAMRLKQHARGVVLCPRSNAWLGNGEPPVSELSAAGANLAVGTDSLASNADLDLFEEARAVRALDTSLTSRWLLRILTLDAARILGLHDLVGSLEPGKHADLAVIDTGPVADPETAVIRKGGTDTVRAVLTHGVWRVRDGELALPMSAIRRDAERALRAAEEALA